MGPSDGPLDTIVPASEGQKVILLAEVGSFGLKNKLKWWSFELVPAFKNNLSVFSRILPEDHR